MTDEELEKKAVKVYLECERDLTYLGEDEIYVTGYVAGYVAGTKENGVVWHDLRKNPDDLPCSDDGIHRKILVQDRYENIYTAAYYPKDEVHKENCFFVEFIEFGFQGLKKVALEQITK